MLLVQVIIVLCGAAIMVAIAIQALMATDYRAMTSMSVSLISTMTAITLRLGRTRSPVSIPVAAISVKR